MIITDKIKLKNNITNEVLNFIIEETVPYIINKADDGIEYFPYNKRKILGLFTAMYCMDGIEFEDGDTQNSLLTAIDENGRLSTIINNFIKEYEDYLMKYLDDIVEFRKQEYLRHIAPDITPEQKTANDKLNKVLLDNAKKQNKILKQQIKMNDQQIKASEFMDTLSEKMGVDKIAALNEKYLSDSVTMNDIAKEYIDSYLGSDEHKSKEREIIESKNAEIMELKKYKDLHDAKNVLSDKR